MAVATNCHSDGILKHPSFPRRILLQIPQEATFALKCRQRRDTSTPYRLICSTHETVSLFYFIWKSCKLGVSCKVILKAEGLTFL